MIGMSSDSIASSIHASSGADFLPRVDAVELHHQAAYLGESVRSLLQGIDLPCLPVCQQTSRLDAQRSGNHWRDRMTGRTGSDFNVVGGTSSACSLSARRQTPSKLSRFAKLPV